MYSVADNFAILRATPSVTENVEKLDTSVSIVSSPFFFQPEHGHLIGNLKKEALNGNIPKVFHSLHQGSVCRHTTHVACNPPFGHTCMCICTLRSTTMYIGCICLQFNLNLYALGRHAQTHTHTSIVRVSITYE